MKKFDGANEPAPHPPHPFIPEPAVPVPEPVKPTLEERVTVLEDVVFGRSVNPNPQGEG